MDLNRREFLGGTAAFAAAGCAGPGPGAARCGFAVDSVVDLPEVGGRLWRFSHAKSGAELVWLERADENLTFGVAFRTLPGDDTGVAHILEHSVLCGSRKYPVKEPFVDLLKSSLYTFLNAFTAKDMTVYPVSSRNRRDFLNLVDVYLDAVFHPRSVETPLMFRQEGWHYEFAKDGSLVRNGVVYNEMKGVYANPEAVGYYELFKLLYPNSCYRFVSGGDPAKIPALDFAGYCAFYRRFYHPSNARIFLDGSIDLDETLARLDAYLAPFDRRAVDAPIAAHAPVVGRATVPYAIGPKENPASKTIVYDGWTFADFDELDKDLAFDVLAEALAGSNEAPLKKTLLARGLCEDLELDSTGNRQFTAILCAKNVPDGRADELRRTVRATLADLAAKGLDHARLAAVIDRLEFNLREAFSGGGTCGISFMNKALDLWLYGGDPARAFRRAEDFAALRRRLDEGWFEKFLVAALVENPHRAELTLAPSTTLAAERVKAEKDELARTLAGWDAATRARVERETAELDAFRNKVDAPEDLAKLPRLELKDIPLRGRARRWTVADAAGTPVLRPTLGAKGVFYASLHFALDDFRLEELAAAPLLAALLGDLATAHYAPLALHTALDSQLGRFRASVTPHARPGDVTRASVHFNVRFAALEAKRDAAADLVAEILLRTRFTDEKAIGDLLRQMRLDYERALETIEARNFARRRAAAGWSVCGTVEETLAGLEQLRVLQRAEKRFAADKKKFCAELAALAQRIFVRARLTASTSENASVAWAGALAARFPRGSVGPRAAWTPRARRREGFTIAAETAYAAKGAHLASIGEDWSGAYLVGARVLSLVYLWDEIRVKGGAYGGGLQVARSGNCGFLSWRDPNPARSLDCYAKAGAALRRFAASDEALDRYVVSTVGASDPCQTPQAEADFATDLYFGGRTYEDLQKMRAAILGARKADLLRFADVLDRLAAESAICVIGGTAGVESCRKRLDAVEAVRVSSSDAVLTSLQT